MNYRLLYIIPQGTGQVSNQTEKRNETLHGPKYYFSSWWLSQFFFSLKYDSTKVYPTLFILLDNWTKHLCLVIYFERQLNNDFLSRNSLSGLQATKSNWTTAFVHEWHVDWLSDCHTTLTTTLMCDLAGSAKCMHGPGRLQFVCTSLQLNYTLLVLVLYHNNSCSISR